MLRIALAAVVLTTGFMSSASFAGTQYVFKQTRGVYGALNPQPLPPDPPPNQTLRYRVNPGGLSSLNPQPLPPEPPPNQLFRR